VVCLPYYKFFNYGEIYASDDLDWSSIVVTEKLDGSLATLYWYKDEWHVSSSGVPDASGSYVFCLKLDGFFLFRELLCLVFPWSLYQPLFSIGNTSKKFSEVFWDIWNELGLRLPEDATKCYIFELLTPLNVIVVRPKEV
jgi:hypothetical protein